RRAAPASLSLRDGDGQSAGAGTLVPVRPAVRVLDARGRPVAFVPVTFAVAAGGGSLTDPNQVTDRDGVAAVGSWRLGPNTGVNTLSATAAGVPSVSFNATGVIGPPASLVVIKQPTSVVAGAPIGPIVVSIRDSNDTPTPGF